MANTVTLTFGYKGTDFTRKYKFDDVETGALSSVKDNVFAFNASVTGGASSAGGLDTFFISDDYDAANNVGELASITAAQCETTTVTEIL
ncbi:MAG: hypothetical protein IKE46_07885 [Selenomonadaceae bacterium]|nr:hypothetical protein [Selenomonadaceae bacterium]MBR4384370.1 hypothetical protein [Selenomonadaceae bacterium]